MAKISLVVTPQIHRQLKQVALDEDTSLQAMMESVAVRIAQYGLHFDTKENLVEREVKGKIITDTEIQDIKQSAGRIQQMIESVARGVHPSESSKDHPNALPGDGRITRIVELGREAEEVVGNKGKSGSGNRNRTPRKRKEA